MILSAIVLIANQFNCLDSDSGGLFDGFNKILPRFSAKKEESKGWGLSNFRIFSSNEKPKESEQKSNWLPNLSNIVSKEPKKESKSWFPNLKILSLVSTKDELPIDQLSSKDASKSNLTIFNWQFVNFNLTNQNNLTNFNFTNWDLFKWSNYTNLYNFTNLTNWNTTNLLNFNSNKDWFIFLKARYYSNLLNNRTLFNYSSSSSSNDTINSTSLDTSLNASNTSNSSSSSTFLNASSIADNASINNSNYSMNFTLFRDRLIKVYDNLTLCEHPCKSECHFLSFYIFYFLTLFLILVANSILITNKMYLWSNLNLIKITNFNF